MSSLSTSADNVIFLYRSSEGEQVNGFVAGLAGSGLHDGTEYEGVPKRTIRLSANSASFEEPDYRLSHASITEETSDVDSEFEMRVSDGSNYPSQFSLLDLSGATSKEDSEGTLEVTNCSTVDVTLDDAEESERLEDVNKSGREEDSVFSPVSSSSFGEFQQKKDDGHDSDSSIDSFGEFDNSGHWTAPTTATIPCDMSREFDNSDHWTAPAAATIPCDMSREDVMSATDQCFQCHSPTSWVLHSSPKKLLDTNFVWVQARSNVTKPSYSWDKLKLHSCLLGALSVRQPISLNRLRPTVSSTKTTPTSITSSASPCSTSSDFSALPSAASPASAGSSHASPRGVLSPSDVEMGVSPEHDSLGEIDGWNSDVSSPEPDPQTHDNVSGSRPSISSIIHRRLTAHRRTHSSPIPNIKTVSPGTRSLTSSPGPLSCSLTKSSSLESPLSSTPSFDESHAGRGLSLLQIQDIQTMRQEMKSRISELSAALIGEFQYRGDADHSKEVKKAFVSAFLAAEEKKSKGQLSSRQRALLPIVCNERCPPTEILVLLTQLLNGLIHDTPHTAELLKHYMYMLCRPCFDN